MLGHLWPLQWQQPLCQREESPRGTSPLSRASWRRTSTLQDTLVQGSEHCRRVSWHQGPGAGTSPALRDAPSLSLQEERGGPAQQTQGLEVFFSFLTPPKALQRAAQHTTPCTDPGSLGRLQDLKLGQAPAWLHRWNGSALGHSSAAISPSCHPTSSLFTCPQPTGCTMGVKRGGHKQPHRCEEELQ